MGEPLKIRNEDDLLAHLMERYRLGAFAKVTQISTERISPDIDLLAIDETNKIITGYELKLLSYRRNWNRVNYNPIYTGIGEALLYLQHGVNRSYLVLGLSPNLPNRCIPTTIDKIEEMTKLFRTMRNIPTAYRYPDRQETFVTTYGFDCFGIMLWTPSDDFLKTELKAERDYLALKRVEGLMHRNRCLVRKEFRWEKKFVEKQREKQKKSTPLRKTYGVLKE